MKRREIEKTLGQNGFELKRHGSNHDIYQKGQTIIEVPRHKEINEDTAKSILKKAGLL